MCANWKLFVGILNILNYELSANFVAEGKHLNLVDAPVSGGVKRAKEGTLTV